MDEIRRWVFTICCGALVCGIISILIPSKSYQKIMSLLLGLFLLLCFLTPVKIDLSSIQLNAEDAEEQRQKVAEDTDQHFFRTAADKSEEAIKEIIYKQLGQYDINLGDVQIYIETKGDAGEEKELIVSIRLPQRMEQYHSVVRKALEYELGVTVRLEYAMEDTT
ncbi:MAG: hypothetical protein VB100_08185 [Angelakisella sp.]|nr:hypothetical protein [Angelakisella sp.]